MPVFEPPPQTQLMRHRQLAPNCSLLASPLCLGAMTLGTSSAATYGDMTKDEGMKILDTFYAAGGNFIDTSPGYHHGESEQWLGEWMAANKNRDELVLCTKYASPWRDLEKDRIQSNFAGSGTKNMRLSLDASLKRLGTTYIDVFYLHYWDYRITIPELMHNLNDLVVTGKVLFLAISDTPAWIVASANQYAREHGLRPFVIYQGMWNAAMRDFERDIIPMCIHEGMAIAPYAVLNQGRFQTEEGFKEKEKHNPGRKMVPLSQRDKDVSAVLEKVASRKGCKLLQVALAYVMQKTPYVFPILGARKASHLEESIAGLTVALSAEDMDEIDRAYPFDHGFPHSFISGTLFGGFDTTYHKPAFSQGDVIMNTTAGPFDWVQPPAALRPSSQ